RFARQGLGGQTGTPVLLYRVLACLVCSFWVLACPQGLARAQAPACPESEGTCAPLSQGLETPREEPAAPSAEPASQLGEPTAPPLAWPEPVVPYTPSSTRWLRPGVLAGGLALFPGFLLHGTGTFVIGQRQTARKLVLMEAAGLVAF